MIALFGAYFFVGGGASATAANLLSPRFEYVSNPMICQQSATGVKAYKTIALHIVRWVIHIISTLVNNFFTSPVEVFHRFSSALWKVILSY